MMWQFTAAVRRHFNTDTIQQVDPVPILKSLCKPPVVFITKQTTIWFNITQFILIQPLPLDYATCFPQT
jgi:hypothetical protein